MSYRSPMSYNKYFDVGAAPAVDSPLPLSMRVFAVGVDLKKPEGYCPLGKCFGKGYTWEQISLKRKRRTDCPCVSS